ncbi:MAG: Ger(x)C family spore germination protein [Oscillospiraceae bacterium]|nr:Ger(x)C family spore germination protein [Oscillospiraceae bacterium]
MKIFVLCALLCLPLAGCSDYRGLDAQTIVMGIAVDEGDNGSLRVTFEIVDMDSLSSSANELETRLLETQGHTFTEAVRAGNAKLRRNMYLGNAETVILSRGIAQSRGLDAITDPLMRDNEVRCTLILIISGEDSARELLEPSGMIMSHFLTQNISAGRVSANAAQPQTLYEVSEILKENASGIALPVVRFSDRETGELTLDGLALFSQGKLTGHLGSGDTPYYLLAKTKLSGGSFRLDDGEKYAVADIRTSVPSINARYDGQKLYCEVLVDISAAAVELSPDWGAADTGAVHGLERDLSAMLSARIKSVIEEMHREHGVDGAGFGSRLRARDPNLWDELSGQWHSLIKEADVSVRCNVRVNNTGLVK